MAGSFKRQKGKRKNSVEMKLKSEMSYSSFVLISALSIVIVIFAVTMIQCDYMCNLIHGYTVRLGSAILEPVGLGYVINSWHATEKMKASASKPEMKIRETPPGMKMFTDEDLKNPEGGQLLLVLLGNVFDVSSGADFYTGKSSYAGFIGEFLFAFHQPLKNPAVLPECLGWKMGKAEKVDCYYYNLDVDITIFYY